MEAKSLDHVRGSGQRNLDDDPKPAALPVLRADAAAVRGDGALRDGKAKAEAFRRVVAAAVEGLEHPADFARRDAGPLVIDEEQRLAVLHGQIDIHAAAFACVLDRVAHDILDRALQQLRAAAYTQPVDRT